MAFLKTTQDETRAEREASLVRQLTEAVVRHFGKGPAEGWHQRDFEQLSTDIAAATGQPISVTTLKRVMGRAKSENMPGLFTLNQMAQYAGFEGWRSFELGVGGAPNATERSPGMPSLRNRHRVNQRQFLATLVGALVLGIVAGALAMWFAPQLKRKPIPQQGVITAEANPHKDLPRIVKFTYRGTPLIQADGAFLSFGNGLMQRFDTDSSGHAIAHYLYDKPGYYRVRVYKDQLEVASTYVVLESLGWARSITVFARELPLPLTTHSDTLLLDGLAACRHLNDSSARFLTRLCRYQDFGVSGDDFELTATLRVDAANPATDDRLTNIHIKSTSQSIVLQFGAWKPRTGFYAQVADYVLPKRSPRQRAFILPVGNLTSYRILVRNGNLAFYADSHLVFRQAYKEPLGKLVGLEFLFAGNARVSDVKLRNRDQETILRSDWAERVAE